MLISNDQNCLCGLEEPYRDCCQPFHRGEKIPLTAEKLMRSRFVAYEYRLTDYLLKTWHNETRPETIEYTDNMHWTQLSVNGRKKGRKKDSEGWVTFVAHYSIGKQAGFLHEKSYFKKNSEGYWQYVDGEFKN
jgi:SEC-C motif-containing protein